MTLLRLGLMGWLAGLLAYLAALGLLYREWISAGDFWAVLFGSAVAFYFSFWILYLPVLRLARRFLPRAWGSWVFPVIAVKLGVVPTALIALYWGGSLRQLVAPEALLFIIMFTVVGVVVGVGFARLDPRG